VSPRHREKGRRYRIGYAHSIRRHLDALTARDRATVIDAMEERLSFQPAVETRNRKRMEPNSLKAGFELRVGALRVYYDVEEEERVVSVLAVAWKGRDRIFIGGEEIVL